MALVKETQMFIDNEDLFSFLLLGSKQDYLIMNGCLPSQVEST